MKSSRLLSIAFLVAVVGCGKTLPELDGISTEAWKSDHSACHAVRQTMISALETQRHKLTSLSEMEVVKLLGRPDQNELYKRNEKFYHYLVEGGPGCTDHKTRRLTIRFNAVGLSKEAIIE
ncbi:MAG: hypothetical protein K1X47_17275 [Cyclobacteriaceae bacterium]|nr:hypothetical protein [Cyclobacteriaceae bacterium]